MAPKDSVPTNYILFIFTLIWCRKFEWFYLLRKFELKINFIFYELLFDYFLYF